MNFPIMMYKGQHKTDNFRYKGAFNQKQYDEFREDGWYSEVRSEKQITDKLKELAAETAKHKESLIEKCLDLGIGSREELAKMPVEELIELTDGGSPVQQVKDSEFINIENGDVNDEFDGFNGKHSNGQNQSIQ